MTDLHTAVCATCIISPHLNAIGTQRHVTLQAQLSEFTSTQNVDMYDQQRTTNNVCVTIAAVENQ